MNTKRLCLRAARLLSIASLMVLVGACAPVKPVKPAAAAPKPASTVTAFPIQAGTSAIANESVSSMASAPASRGRLSLVQICAPAGGKCTLAYVESAATDDVSQLVRNYFMRTAGAPAPTVSLENNCAAGWVAAVESEQGTVMGGGILRAHAAVCGYPTAESAINKALDVCDAKTSGGCRKSNRIKAEWGRWSKELFAGQAIEPGMPVKAAMFDGGMSCDSPVPLVSSPSCDKRAVGILRAAGVRFP